LLPDTDGIAGCPIKNTKKQIQSELKHEEKKNARTAKKEQISEEKRRRRVCAPLWH
jgi:hypothetical protein